LIMRARQIAEALSHRRPILLLHTNPFKTQPEPAAPMHRSARGGHSNSEISMSLSAIDAILRERRLAAMRAEMDQSLDAPPSDGQPGGGNDPNQSLVGVNPDAGAWTSPGMTSGTEPGAAAPPYTFPNLGPTMNVAMGGQPTGVWPRPGLPVPFPDVWEPWRQQAEQGIKGLIDAWRRTFGGSAGSYDPDCDQEWQEAREACREELAKPHPSGVRTGRYRDVEECARGLVSERCGGNKVDYPPRKRR
jgi:hypothetical protein